ncbi:MAG TPA: long-chain fatty acid--CoA ligase [Actinocrinis sp.]|uniref:long-chain fatty acid--CoA ligase n=1 Tax=Actinocrinis sp. TaxID=1920516 RepID=UPI002DDCCF78|nr:long-chain fatty acid--CoA ligase [Actinocrinis sp.]HEV2347689.1 long-chain fatty acid--CoA ligase [Actinocrinis sp.]
MLSTMPHTPLRIRRLLEHGATRHGTAQVTTATETGVVSASYADVAQNAARLARALRDLGVHRGDRVATLMWNNQQHLEAYYAVPTMGAVLHPLNFRLPPDVIAHIANQAEDRVVIVDASVLPMFEGLLPMLRTVRHVIVNGEDADRPSARRVSWHGYAELIASQPAVYPWPDLHEDQAAAVCYTTGTTGAPKGVVYSHRSVYLHATSVSLPGHFALSHAERMLAVVPQFHVLAWGLPYAAFLTGMQLAMPGRFLAAQPLVDFIGAVRPTKAAGVPTVWQSVLDHIAADPARHAEICSLQEIVVGGSACPPSLMRAYEERHGILMLHAWGMTETSPLGSISRPPADVDSAAAWRYRLSQGRFAAEVEARLIGAHGEPLAHDGQTVGELEVRGPWVTASYFKDQGEDKFHDGWLRTGDVGSITADGYLTITDRLKDVIKSGGEWISSIELENLLMTHQDVLEAAVIGVPDEKWGERPLAVVVPRDQHAPVDTAALRDHLAELLPSWQVPRLWAVVGSLPKTSVGKFDKVALRELHAKGALETSAAA